MKKLKTGLILLLALLMSLCLFACGGGHKDHYDNDKDGKCDKCGEPVEHEHVDANNDGKCDICGESMGTTPPPPGGGEDSDYRKIEVDPEVIELTDSDDSAKLEAELAKVVVTATTYGGDEDEFHLSDCDYTSTVKVQVVGEYSFTVALKKDDSKTATLTVVIDHDWGEETDGVKVCAHDKARQETRKEDVVMHYGNFHEGTNPATYSAAKDAAGWTETAAYTNKGTNSAIKEFGYVNDRVVPTLTAGQLEKGTTITIRGKAQTTASDTSPWGTAGVQQQWNFPSIGIADKYNNSESAGYQYGVAVIVRQEGWVLYNGIGQGDKNVLGGIMGGDSATTSNWQNYGSNPAETTTKSPDPNGEAAYVHGVVPSDWSSVENWWVYSTGTGMPSGTYYQTADEYEYTWNYREDGVIELTYTNVSVGNTLKIYIKVPDSSVGYYDTIIHGDYNDMTITESVITTKRTPKAFRLNGVKSGANSVYAENQAFDATTLDAEMQYEQTGETWETIQIANGQVYAYQGTLSRADLLKEANAEEFASTDPALWKSLDSNKLSGATTIYKVHLEKGGKVYDELLGEGAITVLPNKVASAIGADVTVGADDAAVDFANNGKVGALDFSVDTAARNVVLTLAGESYVQKLSDAQKAKFTGTVSATRYIALRINAAALGEAFRAEGVKVNNGSVPVIAQLEGDDLCLVLALSEAGKYTVTGAQDTAIVLDLTNLKGFSLESEITGELKLNAGGDLVLKYTLPQGTTVDMLSLRVGTRNLSSNVLKELLTRTEPYNFNSYSITSVKLEGTTFTVNITVPAANLGNYQPVTFRLDYSNGSTADSIVDSIDYNMTVDASKYQLQSPVDGYYGYAERGTFNVLKVFEMEDVKDGAISGEFTLNLNDGDLENFKKYGLITVSYRVANGELVLTNAPAGVTGDVTVIGTYGDSRDTDKGAYVLFTIDVASFGIEGDYYVNFVDGLFDAKTAPAKITKVSGETITEVNVSGTPKVISTAGGNCYEEGLYAWEIKDGDDVIFYANAAAAGGEHIDADGDNVCDLCGGTITVNTSIKSNANWFPAGGIKQDIVEGDVFTFTGQYADDITETGFGSVLAIMIEEADGAGWDNAGNDENTNGTWHTTQDGYATWTNFGWDSSRAPYAEGIDEFGEGNGYERFSSNIITEDHPYNTANGWINDYGTTIDETNFNEAKQGGTFRFIVIRENNVITTTAQLWSSDMVAFHSVPYFEYTTKVTVDPNAGRYTVYLMGKQQNNNVVHLVDDKVNVTMSRLTNSAIEKAESVKIGENDAPTAIEYKASVSGTNAVLALSGIAAKKDSTYYASFKITFKQALVSTAFISGFGDATGKAITGMTATLSEDRKTVDVYLPIASGLKEAYIFFTNYEASTMQADIKIDLNDLAVSDVVATVAGYDKLTIAEGTFTIAYTNVQNSDELNIGGVSKKLSELASKVDFGNGYSAQAAITGTTATVTFTKAAADLTKVIKGVEIRLERAGNLLARNVFDAVVKVSGGTEIGSTAWYATANGNQLVLITNTRASLMLNVNAGKLTAAADLGIYDITPKADGKSFENSNILTKAATLVYSAAGDLKLYVVTIDLSGLKVEAATPYGFQNDNTGFYYLVDAQRKIEKTAVAQETEATLREATCALAGVKGYKAANEAFYFNLSSIPVKGHEWQEKTDATTEQLNGYDKMYTCKNECGATKYEQTSTQSWGKGTAGSYAGWGDFQWETFGFVSKGGLYEITGTNLANEAFVWNLPEPGLTDKADTNAQGYRIDNYVQQDNTALGLNAVYSFKDAKNDAFVYSFEAIEAAVKTNLDGATLTYTFDYTDATQFVIKLHLVNSDVLDFTVTVTITAANMLDVYYIAFHQDGNMFTASNVSTIVPKDAKVPAALSKHVHKYDETTHRCPDDGALDPAHTTHTYNRGEDLKAEGTLYCACGELNPAHTHAYENGQCKYCVAVQPAAGVTGGTALEITWEAGGFATNKWAQEGFKKGAKIVVYGAQTKAATTDAWFSLIAEVDTLNTATSATMRTDAYGWYFDNNAGSHLIEDSRKQNEIRMSNNTTVALNWDIVKEIENACDYRVEFNWTGEDIVVTMAMTCTAEGTYKGYTFTQKYTLSVGELTTVNVRFGAEQAAGTAKVVVSTGMDA